LIRIWLLWSVIPILGSLDQEFILETNPQAKPIHPKPAGPHPPATSEPPKFWPEVEATSQELRTEN